MTFKEGQAHDVHTRTEQVRTSASAFVLISSLSVVPACLLARKAFWMTTIARRLGVRFTASASFCLSSILHPSQNVWRKVAQMYKANPLSSN